jgi:hypothetical protein
MQRLKEGRYYNKPHTEQHPTNIDLFSSFESPEPCALTKKRKSNAVFEVTAREEQKLK